MILYAGRQMRADIYEGPWVFVEWLYPGQMKYTAFKELRQIESRILGEGLAGWYAKSEKDHGVMHRFLERFKASVYGEDEHSMFFRKPATAFDKGGE